MPEQTERPDLYPPSCKHPDACDCSIVETTRIVPTEIPVFAVRHSDASAELPTGAQARDWLADRHSEAERAKNALPGAPDVTVTP